MPQAWNEHANDGDLNVGPRLVEHEEIVTCPGGDLDTGIDLIARVVVNLEVWTPAERSDCRSGSGTDNLPGAAA